MSELRSLRLQLDPLAEQDGPFYCGLYTDPEIMRHVGKPLDAEAARRSFRAVRCDATKAAPRRRQWVMRENPSREPVGLLGLDCQEHGAEVGALILPIHQARGYAAEAIAAVATYAFDTLGLTHLHTRHDGGHAAAAALMRKLGFEPSAPTSARGPDKFWQLSRKQWQASAYRRAAVAPQ